MVKFKSRYLLLDLNYVEEKEANYLDSGKFVTIIKNETEKFFGDVGLGKISKNLQVKYVNPYTNVSIIRVGKEHVNLLWTVLAMMNKLDGEAVRIRIISVSGTIKKIEEKAKKFLNTFLIHIELNK